MSAFPIDEMCAIVQYELIYSLNTGENSCLEVTNFAPRSIQGKDDASAVGEGDLLSEAGIVVAFGVVKVMLWDGVLGKDGGGNLD